jgi:hypothetical protein
MASRRCILDIKPRLAPGSWRAPRTVRPKIISGSLNWAVKYSRERDLPNQPAHGERTSRHGPSGVLGW